MIYNLSHTDLDGVGCNIIISNVFKNVTYFNTSYGKIQEYLEILDNSIQNEQCAVFITDLMFKGEDYTSLIDLCNRKPNAKFFYLDHHHYDFELNGLSNLKIIHDESKCGTMLTWDFLKNKIHKESFEYLENLVQKINAFDLYLTESEHFKAGFILNELFWSYKLKPFFIKFKDKKPTLLSIQDKKNFKNIVDEKNELFEKAEKNGSIFKVDDLISLTFFDRYFSFYQRELNFKMYINIFSFGSASIRISNEILPEKAEEIRSQMLEFLDSNKWSSSHGGHIYAWGITLKSNEPEFMLDFAKEFITISNNILRKELL